MNIFKNTFKKHLNTCFKLKTSITRMQIKSCSLYLAVVYTVRKNYVNAKLLWFFINKTYQNFCFPFGCELFVRKFLRYTPFQAICLMITNVWQWRKEPLKRLLNIFLSNVFRTRSSGFSVSQLIGICGRQWPQQLE